MLGMLKRLITNKVIDISKRVPAVALLGPRQVGKTTVDQMLTKQKRMAKLNDFSY